MTRLIQALDAIVARGTDLPAVIDRGAIVGYSELQRLVRRGAASLHRSGLRPGDMVGLSVRQELPRLVAQLALMRLGCTSVTLASFEPLEARQELAHRCGARVVVTEEGIVQPDGVAVVRLPDMDTLRGDAVLDAEGRLPTLPDASVAAVVLTSSGTTGLPKLVRLTQAQLAGYDQAEWPPRTHSVANLASPAESNAWTWASLCNLLRRRTLAFLDPAEASFAQACRRHGVTKTFVWPARLPDLIAECRSTPGGSPMRDVCVLTGGAPVEAEVQRAVIEHVTPHLVLQYGGTEAGVVTWTRADPDRLDPGAVGHPLPGIELGVFDDAGRRLPAGEMGYVRVRCAWGATEYWQDPEASRRAFVDGWWQPGDLGRLGEDGMLTFAGRGDDMMVMNAINIFPAEIERVAAGFPGVVECAAFPVTAARYGQIPVLAVVRGPEFDADALMAQCRARLGVRAPRKVVIVDRLPRNTAGKVLRRELSVGMAPQP